VRETGEGAPRPLRVALLSYRGNPHCGGQGVYVRHLSRELAALGHAVTVFAGQPYPVLDPGVRLVKVPSLDLYREEDPFRIPRAREIASPVDLLEVATMCTGGFPEPRTFSLRVAPLLLARRGELDVVHDNQSLGTGLLRVLAGGLPVVASVHHPVTVDLALELAEAPSRARRRSLRRWYRFARMQARVARALPRLLTVSRSSARDVAAEMGVDPGRIAVVPVGVDDATFRPYPQVARVPGRIMTTASSDVALKGLAYLLEALAKLRTEHEQAHLVVIGRLREQSRAREVLGRFGLERAVTFVSGEADEQIARRYATASCAVVPSLYEGFSLPAIEAMATGTPLVATTGGALPEVVGEDGDAALLVPPADASALAEAIGRLLGDARLARRLAERARRRVLDRFTWAATATRTAEEYRRVLEGGGRC